MSAFRPWLLVPAVVLAACASDRLVSVDGAGSRTALAPHAAGTSSGVYVDDDPHFVTAAPDAPTFANPVVELWAKKGRDTTVTMYYHSSASGRDSVPFFSLRVRAKSLWKRPDGSTITDGDSVRITLTLVDSTRLIVDCQPSGLLFSPGTPARLKMSYANADDDLNGDGTVNAADSTLTRALIIWRKETATAPWLPILTSTNSTGPHEVEADIGGFTGYAIAY